MTGTQHSIAGTVITMPVQIRRAKQHMAMFSVDADAAQHLIDYIATTPEDLFRQMQGKPFKRFNGESATLDLEGQPIVPFNMTLKERILDALMEPDGGFPTLTDGLPPANATH